MALHDYADDNASVTYDVLIVGAGIVGSAIAITLARQGRRVLILERDMRQPDRIVGELLQPGGVVALEYLGLDDCLHEIDGQFTKGYRMVCHEEETVLYYPRATQYLDAGLGVHSATAKKQRLPETIGSDRYSGVAFHNGRLVSKLRERVLREENVRVVEAAVVGLLFSDDGSTVIGVTSRAKDASESQLQSHRAHLTVIADGHSSNLRSQLTDKKPIINTKYYALTLPDTKFEGGLSQGITGVPLGSAIYQIDNKDTRIMVHVPDDIVKSQVKGGSLRDFMQEKVVSTIPARLQPAAQKAISAGRMRSMNNAIMSPCAINTSGVVLIGDALNMRHPVTGGGMTVGLKDAIILSELLHPARVPSFQDHAAVDRQTREFLRRRKPHSMVLNILAQLMYLTMANDDEHLRIVQYGFIAYVNTGDPKVELLSALLAGLLPSPSTLLSMFITITMFSVRLHVQKQYAISAWLIPLALWQCFMAVAKAGYLTTPYVLPEVMA